MNVLLAAFLAAHGLIHVSYLAPAPPRTAGGPEWPFEVTQSWLVTGLGLDAAAMRPLATVLVLVTAAALLGAAAVALGWLPSSLWLPLLVVGTSGSLVTLGLFFHPWLVAGIAIDLVLLWATLVAGWMPPALET
jgi:hypothetical protein